MTPGWLDDPDWLRIRIRNLQDDLDHGRPIAWEPAGGMFEYDLEGHAINPPREQLRHGITYRPYLRTPLIGYQRKVVIEVLDIMQRRLHDLQTKEAC